MHISRTMEIQSLLNYIIGPNSRYQLLWREGIVGIAGDSQNQNMEYGLNLIVLQYHAGWHLIMSSFSLFLYHLLTILQMFHTCSSCFPQLPRKLFEIRANVTQQILNKYIINKLMSRGQDKCGRKVKMPAFTFEM